MALAMRRGAVVKEGGEFKKNMLLMMTSVRVKSNDDDDADGGELACPWHRKSNDDWRATA